MNKTNEKNVAQMLDLQEKLKEFFDNTHDARQRSKLSIVLERSEQVVAKIFEMQSEYSDIFELLQNNQQSESDKFFQSIRDALIEPKLSDCDQLKEMAKFFIATKYFTQNQKTIIGRYLQNIAEEPQPIIEKVQQPPMRIKPIQQGILKVDEEMKEKLTKEHEAFMKKCHNGCPLLDGLNKQCREIAESLSPTEKDIERITRSFLQVESIVSEVLNQMNLPFTLLKYGSTVNGLAVKGDSDLDLTIIIHDEGREDYKIILDAIRKKFSKYNSNKFNDIQVINATFGSLLTLVDSINHVDIEISINKVIEVFNSMLLYTYCRLDSRFRELVLILKKWNKKNFPDKQQRLNSYSITLMLIAYLQKQGHLPDLQKVVNTEDNEKIVKYKKQIPLPDSTTYMFKEFQTNVFFQTEIDVIGKYFSSAVKKESISEQYTVGELLSGFFYFYLCRFDSERHAMRIFSSSFFDKKQVRGIIEANNKDEYVNEKLISRIDTFAFMIIDPFDFTYNPAKSIKINSGPHQQYLAAFAQTLQNIVDKGQIIIG